MSAQGRLPDREVLLPDPELLVTGHRGRLRLALETAGFSEDIDCYGDLISTRDGVSIRFAVDDDLELMVYPLNPGTPAVPSVSCRWRVSFGLGCPDELIVAAVNIADAEDQRPRAAAEREQINNHTA
ncbi:hypothetical protein R8Z50_22890 [Longispora sp. K20-0274]|uniref:hypothetical protein n=1 Tax=Longispora sp. K20-0274 TaxID=3088255 RepID=UPI00399A420A